MNPPNNLRDLPKVKNLFTTYRKIDLEDFLCNEFLKNYTEVNRSLSSKQKDNKVGSPKRYTQRYGPNTFGTAPRFTGDYVPTHSKDVSYNRKWIRSESQKNIKGE